MFMTMLAKITQNNAILAESNDSRNYAHQTVMRVEIAAGATYTVPVTNNNGGETLLMIRTTEDNTGFTATLTDTVSGMAAAAVECNRFFAASLKGLTGLTIRNDSGAADTFLVAMGDE